MLSMTFLLPISFAVGLWYAHRSNTKKERKGEGFQPDGKIRWS